MNSLPDLLTLSRLTDFYTGRIYRFFTEVQVHYFRSNENWEATFRKVCSSHPSFADASRISVEEAMKAVLAAYGISAEAHKVIIRPYLQSLCRKRCHQGFLLEDDAMFLFLTYLAQQAPPAPPLPLQPQTQNSSVRVPNLGLLGLFNAFPHPSANTTPPLAQVPTISANFPLRHLEEANDVMDVEDVVHTKVVETSTTMIQVFTLPTIRPTLDIMRIDVLEIAGRNKMEDFFKNTELIDAFIENIKPIYGEVAKDSSFTETIWANVL